MHLTTHIRPHIPIRKRSPQVPPRHNLSPLARLGRIVPDNPRHRDLPLPLIEGFAVERALSKNEERHNANKDGCETFEHEQPLPAFEAGDAWARLNRK